MKVVNRTRKEAVAWRMTFALTGVAGGLFVLLAVELIARHF
jgi:hypothetical protein